MAANRPAGRDREKGASQRPIEKTVGVYEQPKRKGPSLRTMILVGAVVLAVLLLIIFTQVGHASTP
jgi:hypothetical protein